MVRKMLLKKYSVMVISITMICLFLNGCEKNTNTHKIETGGGEVIPGVVNSYKHIDRKLTEKDFDFLKKDMSLDEIKAKVGEPNGWVGSGIISPIYELENKNYIMLIFGVNYEKLQSAKIVDKDGKKIDLNIK